MKYLALFIFSIILISCQEQKFLPKFGNDSNGTTCSYVIEGKKNIATWSHLLYRTKIKRGDKILFEYCEDSADFKFDVYSINYQVLLASGSGALNRDNPIAPNPSSLFDLQSLFRTSSRDFKYYNYESVLIEQTLTQINGWTKTTIFNTELGTIDKIIITDDYPIGSRDSTFLFDANGICRKIVISQPGRVETVVLLDE